MKPPSTSSFSSHNAAPCLCQGSDTLWCAQKGTGVRECVQRWCQPISAPQGAASSHPLCLMDNSVKKLLQNWIPAMLCTRGGQPRVRFSCFTCWSGCQHCPLLLPASDRWNAATAFCASKLFLVPCTRASRNTLNLLQKEIRDPCH